jgi:hypothetical protein
MVPNLNNHLQKRTKLCLVAAIQGSAFQNTDSIASLYLFLVLLLGIFLNN